MRPLTGIWSYQKSTLICRSILSMCISTITTVTPGLSPTLERSSGGPPTSGMLWSSLFTRLQSIPSMVFSTIWRSRSTTFLMSSMRRKSLQPEERPLPTDGGWLRLLQLVTPMATPRALIEMKTSISSKRTKSLITVVSPYFSVWMTMIKLMRIPDTCSKSSSMTWSSKNITPQLRPSTSGT